MNVSNTTIDTFIDNDNDTSPDWELPGDEQTKATYYNLILWLPFVIIPVWILLYRIVTYGWKYYKVSIPHVLSTCSQHSSYPKTRPGQPDKTLLSFLALTHSWNCNSPSPTTMSNWPKSRKSKKSKIKSENGRRKC